MFCCKGHHRYACFSSSSGFMVYQVVCFISPDSIRLDLFHKVPVTESISCSVSAWFLSRAQSPQVSPLTFWTHSLFVSFKCKKRFRCSFGSCGADVEWHSHLQDIYKYDYKMNMRQNYRMSHFIIGWFNTDVLPAQKFSTFRFSSLHLMWAYVLGQLPYRSF